MGVESDVLNSPAYLSLIDLLTEIWDELYPAMWNIILIFVTAISSYIAKHVIEKTRRNHKGLDMIKMLREIYKVLETKTSKNGACSRREMLKFIRCNISRDLQTQMAMGMMTEDTYNDIIASFERRRRRM